jgi:hypothetical protein
MDGIFFFFFLVGVLGKRPAIADPASLPLGQALSYHRPLNKIKIFKKKFKKKIKKFPIEATDVGKEYFEGCVEETTPLIITTWEGEDIVTSLGDCVFLNRVVNHQPRKRSGIHLLFPSLYIPLASYKSSLRRPSLNVTKSRSIAMSSVRQGSRNYNHFPFNCQA